MKKVITSFLFVLSSLSLFSEPVNAVLGDESFRFYFGKYPDAKTPEVLRIETHLRYAEWLLCNAPVSHLSAEKRESRMHMLDLLRQYRMERKFPSNYDHPGERRPCFIDKYRRICAVGYLIEQTAGRALAEKINKQYQYDFINDMHMPELTAWVERSGLTQHECAMIQPEYADSNDGRIVIPESLISREAIAEYIRSSVHLPDSIFEAGPVILRVNFVITSLGTVSRVRIDKPLPEEPAKKIVKAIKKLKFKPAYQYHYIREEERYITENIESKEKMILVIHKADDARYPITTRTNVLVYRDGLPTLEQYVRHVLEIYSPKVFKDSDQVTIKGSLTDLEFVSSMKLFAYMGDAQYKQITHDIPVQQGQFEATFVNENYTSLKASFYHNNNCYAALTEIKPVDQKLLITFTGVEDISVICGGGCVEHAQETKKAWYQPIIIEQQNEISNLQPVKEAPRQNTP